MINFAIGADECSWGSVAGPLFVGAVACDYEVMQEVVGITDSKKYSSNVRLLEAESMVKAVTPFTVVKTRSAKELAVEGYEPCRAGLFRAACSVLRRRVFPKRAFAMIDGCSTFGVRNACCYTKGDTLHRIIGAASIMAKAEQIRYMMRLHQEYPEYGFDQHKGYLTALHWQRILEHGMIPSVHRARVIVNAFSNRHQTARFREE